MEPTTTAAAPVLPNGGFPEPWLGEPVQLIRCRHEACGETTLVRLPRDVPTKAIRVVVCGACQESFEVDELDDMGVLAPARRRQPRPSVRPPRVRVTKRKSPLDGWWALVAVPVAIAAVVGGLLLVQGGDSSQPGSSRTVFSVDTDPGSAPAPAPTTSAPASAATAPTPTPAPAASPGATLVRTSTYSLALPSGWTQSTPAGGVTFAASSTDGDADAELWVRKAPSQSFAAFEKQSLAQLRSIAGSARVVDRVPAPTAEGTIVHLGAGSAGTAAYNVTLRADGPYRYYLSTTLQPNPSPEAAKGVDLIANSLTPTATGKATP